MTEKPAAFLADFTNLRNVQSRKVVQLVFEIDVARTDEALNCLGWPDAVDPKKCAIAVYNDDAQGV